MCILLQLLHKLASVSTKPYLVLKFLFHIIKIFLTSFRFFIIKNIVPPRNHHSLHSCVPWKVVYLLGLIPSWVKKGEPSLSLAIMVVSK